MQKIFEQLKQANRQTLYFILMAVIYIGALLWTTAQSYARLEYNRSDGGTPIIIQPKQDHS